MFLVCFHVLLFLFFCLLVASCAGAKSPILSSGFPQALIHHAWCVSACALWTTSCLLLWSMAESLYDHSEWFWDYLVVCTVMCLCSLCGSVAWCSECCCLVALQLYRLCGTCLCWRSVGLWAATPQKLDSGSFWKILCFYFFSVFAHLFICL